MATRYLVPGGTGDYDSTTNWAATSGGASGASFPVLGDDVIIDVNSANAPLNINVVSACKSFICSNYTGTVSILNNFTISSNVGNITLSAGMSVTGPASFIKTTGGLANTITSNGVVFDCDFVFAAPFGTTTVITGVMQVNRNLTFSLNSTLVNSITGSTIRVGGNVIHSSPVSGTATIELFGSTPATITQVATRYIGTNLIINKGAGAFNQVDLYWGANGRTLTYTSGLVNHTGTLFTAFGGSLNTNGMTWNILEPSSITLNFTSICRINTIESITVGGNLRFAGTHGFDCDNFIFSSINASGVNLRQNITYKINSYIFITSTQYNNVQVRTNTGIANLELGLDSVMQLYKVDFLRIRATKKILRVVGGTVTNCTNVYTLSSNMNQYSKTK